MNPTLKFETFTVGGRRIVCDSALTAVTPSVFRASTAIFLTPTPACHRLILSRNADLLVFWVAVQGDHLSSKSGSVCAPMVVESRLLNSDAFVNVTTTAAERLEVETNGLTFPKEIVGVGALTTGCKALVCDASTVPAELVA